MPLQKSFKVLLETGTVSANAHPTDSTADSFVALNGTDSSGAVDTDDHLIAVDASASEAKPSGLTEAADGSGDYAKEKVIATDAGWAYMPGYGNSGNDNKGAQPEVIQCIRQLRRSIDVPTSPQITIGNTSSKTTYYPDGDTFTGASSSSAGDVTVYCYFNEPIHVTGTPQLQLKQATALGSNFGTIMDYNSTYSDLSNGIMAFALGAGEDTRTSAVTNNTLGINSDDSISLNSGTIEKMGHERVILESGLATNEQGHLKLDGTTSSSNDQGQFVLHEGGVGLPADTDLTADSDATMTVS